MSNVSSCRLQRSCHSTLIINRNLSEFDWLNGMERCQLAAFGFRCWFIKLWNIISDAWLGSVACIKSGLSVRMSCVRWCFCCDHQCDGGSVYTQYTQHTYTTNHAKGNRSCANEEDSTCHNIISLSISSNVMCHMIIIFHLFHSNKRASACSRARIVSYRVHRPTDKPKTGRKKKKLGVRSRFSCDWVAVTLWTVCFVLIMMITLHLCPFATI